MVEHDDLDVEEEDITELHEAEGSLTGGWPAILLTIAMISAAVYAFSPRPYPPFPETQIKASQLMTNGLAQQGSRFIAVGELGRIMYADDANGPWKEAGVENPRGSTLTKVKFIGDDVALAVGHSGLLLRSEDGGKTWKELLFNEDSADPLLGIAGPFTGAASGKLYVFGAFGQFYVSTDGGQNWRRESPVVEEDEIVEDTPASESTAEAVTDPALDVFGDASSDPTSEDYDPFAEFESGGMAADYTNRHMYDMTQASDGSLFLVGERGMILRSTDGGATWKANEEIYTGSFYGALPVGENSVLVYGMRGNAFLTRNLGKTWVESDIPVKQGLYGAAMDDDGTILLVGASNTVMVSRDAGASFRKVTKRGPNGVVSVLSLENDTWLMAGEGGVGKKSMLKSPAGAAGDKS